MRAAFFVRFARLLLERELQTGLNKTVVVAVFNRGEDIVEFQVQIFAEEIVGAQCEIGLLAGFHVVGIEVEVAYAGQNL